MIYNPEQPLRAQIQSLDAGEELTIPMGTYPDQTVRTYACEQGLRLGSVYTVHRDREARTITVTRTS